MATNEEEYVKRIGAMIIFGALLVLSFILIKPIIYSIISGILLAFIFSPVYDRLYKIVRVKSIAALLICVFLAVIVILPIWFLTPVLLDQALKIYLYTQQADLLTPLKELFPSLFSSEVFSQEIATIFQVSVTKATGYITNAFEQIILNLPLISLQLLVAFFTFFYILKDKDEVIEYVKSLLPFSKDVEKKLFEYTRGLTTSVIYGQVIVGIIQGLIAGLGFFIFGVKNALLLTLMAAIAGILPIIGPVIVWLPVAIFLFISGVIPAAIGVTLFGLVASTVDNILRPYIVSKRTRVSSAVVLIGMVGGLLLFGLLGLILGPLILGYLLIVLEIYRNKKSPGVFVAKEENSHD